MNQSTGSNKPYPYPSYGKMMHDGFNGLLTSITGKALPQTRMGRVRAPTRITGSTNTELREVLFPPVPLNATKSGDYIDPI